MVEVTHSKEFGTQVIGAVIVARMKSSRFPGKSMVEIAGKPSLEWLVHRLSYSRLIQRMVIATTTDPADEPIVKLAQKLGVGYFRGSEEDVLGRVLNAAKSIGLDIVVHVTGDCPLVDPVLADKAIDTFFKKSVDYIKLDPEMYSNGFDIEVFSLSALSQVNARFDDPWIREHVTEPLYTMPELFSSIKQSAPSELNRPQYRICIDTQEDFSLVKQIFEHFLPDNPDFGAVDIVRFLDSRPDLVAINTSVKQTKYRAGVVGLGKIGALNEAESCQEWPVNTHAGGYRRFGKTQLAAACDINPKNRERFDEDWKIQKVYDRAEEMFSQEDLSLVSIATPVESHAQLCMLAVDAGVRAILCEKPFVSDCEKGKEVIQACREHGVVLAINHWMRWSTTLRSIRDFLGRGGIGKVQTLRCHYSKGAMNSGTHAVDLLRFLFGEIVSVRGTESRPLDIGEENIGGVLELASDLTAYLTVNDYRHFFAFELDVIGTQGRLRMADKDVEFWDFATCDRAAAEKIISPSKLPFETSTDSPFEVAISELVNFLDNGAGSVACSGEDGLRAVEVIQAIQRSLDAGGRRVELPFVENTKSKMD
jgi:spore coat polysaccharide biosynthesis protein SpsF (cytidylyltransferase family)/predicted dehydrogenase